METFQSQQLPFVGKKPIFERVGELASLASMPSVERESYMRSLNQYRTTAATYEYEHMLGEEEGMTKGFEKGLAKGKAEGIEEGLVKGREETLVLTARNLKNAGVAIAVIMQCTGLSEDEINKL